MSSGTSTGLKLIIAAIVVIALLGAAFWAGSKALKKDATNTPSPTATSFQTSVPLTGSPTATYISGRIGNRVGDIAPDFSRKSSSGKSVSLYDYIGQEAVTLKFIVDNQVLLRPSSSSEVTLQDPDRSVYHLYNATTMPYEVVIGVDGVIQFSGTR